MINILLSSDGGEVFLAIITIIWSILCIVLFFKIWGMTNNVKRIMELLSIQFGYNEIKSKSHKDFNQKNSAQPKKKTISKASDKDPLMSFYEDCTKLYSLCHSKDEFEGQVDDIIANYIKTTGNDYGYLKTGLWDQLKQI